MTQDRIIELARESQKEKLTAAGGHWFQMEVNDLERFATLVRAQTLEEAAGVCEDTRQEYEPYTGHPVALNYACAAAIRQLKETK